MLDNSEINNTNCGAKGLLSVLCLAILCRPEGLPKPSALLDTLALAPSAGISGQPV